MAILIDSNQYKFGGRGPLDAKALVKTYAELLDVDAWTVDGTLVAYNGMITAVWLNKDDTSKNGIYFLFDSAVTSAVKKPDVTNEANWHRLSDIESFSGFADQINSIQTGLERLQKEVDTLADCLEWGEM